MKTIATVKQISVTKQLVLSLVATAGAVILPQIFHFMGIISGTGNALGSALLPMHLPVILIGFMAGPLAGGIAGALSPLVSFALTGMPSAALLPFMIVELCVYGIISGFLSTVRINSVLKVLIVQLAGRAIRACVILVAVKLLAVSSLPIAIIWTSILQGVFGLALQLVLIPLLIKNEQ